MARRKRPGLRSEGDWIADRFEVFAVHPGGMGVVYIAHDRLGPAGRQVVAVKTLRDEWLDDPDRLARFAAECRIWVQLGSHPNIVHAHEVVEVDDKPHIVLELVTGGDLRKRIGTPALDVAQALRYGVQFCLGMEHAARQGLRCHRDVKPGNLMVTVDGRLKITDFGLAVVRDELFAAPSVPDPARGIDLDDSSTVPLIEYDNGSDHRPPPEPAPASADPDAALTVLSSGGDGTLARMTQTGSMLGTMPYMAPEQFRDSKAVDILADIYAIGVVLFEMIAHRTPFPGKTLAMYDRQHSRYAPPPLVPAIPRRFAREAEAIDAIVRRCLSKEPADRFESPLELRTALVRVLRRVDPDGPATP